MIKLKAGKLLIPVDTRQVGKRYFLRFPFNRELLTEIKSMEGAKWHGYDTPPVKEWSIPITGRNLFSLSYLAGNAPYAPYKTPLQPFTPFRKIYAHQVEMCRHVITRRYCLLAAEMGVGKTLTMIECMEHFKLHEDWDNWWYVAPKLALEAVKLEFKKWDAKVIPTFITYEQLVKRMENWENGSKAPRGVCFDESSKIKTPTSKRSQASKSLAEGVRSDWGARGVVVPMSGTPAPKAPTDWWHQCEVACPGYIKEGDINKFRYRYAIIQQKESIQGGVYPQHVAWRDDVARCGICGIILEQHAAVSDHSYKQGTNEVAALYKRLKGLVQVINKKDCLDLPEKVYRVIRCEPTPATLRAASMITATAARTITALTLLRELSDGFQYTEEIVGSKPCESCHGAKVVIDQTIVPCYNCNGTGEEINYKRSAERVSCPKDDALVDLLDEHDDYGRMVVYAGFTESINRVRDLCLQAGWEVVLIDGSRHILLKPNTLDFKQPESLLEYFADLQGNKVAFVGHPQSSGFGVTLTASPSIVYYSNDFNGESRIQSEDRIHRPGCRGANIIDLVHLYTDELVLENLRQKKRLEALTLGKIKESING